MTSEIKRWYVVRTRAHSEPRAALHLGRQGFTVYCPRYLKHRHHARKVEVAAVPLFPRYLFVAIDALSARWRAIRSTFGVADLVCHADGPAWISDNMIAEIRDRENESGFVQLARSPAFKPGDKIRVLGGPFSDCLGLFEGMTDRERVAVLLELLGRKVRVMMDVGVIEAA